MDNSKLLEDSYNLIYNENKNLKQLTTDICQHKLLINEDINAIVLMIKLEC
jgi:hypothetical protein